MTKKQSRWGDAKLATEKLKKKRRGAAVQEKNGNESRIEKDGERVTRGGRKCRRQGAMKNEAHWEIRGD